MSINLMRYGIKCPCVNVISTCTSGTLSLSNSIAVLSTQFRGTRKGEKSQTTADSLCFFTNEGILSLASPKSK